MFHLRWNFLLLAWKWDAALMWERWELCERECARETWKRVRIWFQRSFAQKKRAMRSNTLRQDVDGNYAPTNSASAYLKNENESMLIFRGQLNILQLSILTPHIIISSCSWWSDSKILSNIKNQVFDPLYHKIYVSSVPILHKAEIWHLNFPTYANPNLAERDKLVI